MQKDGASSRVDTSDEIANTTRIWMERVVELESESARRDCYVFARFVGGLSHTLATAFRATIAHIDWCVDRNIQPCVALDDNTLTVFPYLFGLWISRNETIGKRYGITWYTSSPEVVEGTLRGWIASPAMLVMGVKNLNKVVVLPRDSRQNSLHWTMMCNEPYGLDNFLLRTELGGAENSFVYFGRREKDLIVDCLTSRLGWSILMLEVDVDELRGTVTGISEMDAHPVMR